MWSVNSQAERTVSRRVLISLAVAAIMLASVAAVAQEGESPRVDAAAASRLASALVGVEPASVLFDRGPSRETFEVRGTDGRVVWVDAGTGKVGGVMGSIFTPPAEPAEVLSTSQARGLAYAVVSSIEPEVSTMTLVDTICTGESVAFHWQRIDENGAWLPQWVTASVGIKTGDVGGYAARDEEVLIETVPKIAEGDARSTMLQRLPAHSTVEERRLVLAVFRDRSGAQRLVWYGMFEGTTRVPIRGDAFEPASDSSDEMVPIGLAEKLYVDALTGLDVTDEF